MILDGPYIYLTAIASYAYTHTREGCDIFAGVTHLRARTNTACVPRHFTVVEWGIPFLMHYYIKTRAKRFDICDIFADILLDRFWPLLLVDTFKLVGASG